MDADDKDAYVNTNDFGDNAINDDMDDKNDNNY